MVTCMQMLHALWVEDNRFSHIIIKKGCSIPCIVTIECLRSCQVSLHVTAFLYKQNKKMNSLCGVGGAFRSPARWKVKPGSLRVCTTSGSLKVCTSGSLRVCTTSGSVKVCTTSGSLRVCTTSGSLRICTTSGSLKVCTSGSLRVCTTSVSYTHLTLPTSCCV